MNCAKMFHIVVFLLSAGCCSAGTNNSVTVPLAYGVNLVDFGSDGATGMAVLGRRENFNAHGFDVLTLYLKPAVAKYGREDWQLVSLFDGDKEKLTLGAGGGADCLLHDFRLIRKSVHGKVSLLVAERDPGNGYAAPALVHFKSYQLMQNTENEVGWPLYYFKLVDNKVSKNLYCDVGEAFAKELGIGPYRDAAQ